MGVFLGHIQSKVFGTTIKGGSNALDIILCVSNQGTNFEKSFCHSIYIEAPTILPFLQKKPKEHVLQIFSGVSKDNCGQFC